ncbi:dihydrodipicolinate synthase family protein [Thermodesulfobacteriota bacterium]
MTKTSVRRKELLKTLFGEPVPRLWCPPLTHYTPEGKIDRDRMAAHWGFMAPHVDGFLVPGSTSDGWEMDDAETRELIDLSLELAAKLKVRLLVGVLKTTARVAILSVRENFTTLKARTGNDDPLEAMRASRVCGFTVCSPKGRDQTQEKIETDLEGLLELGFPTVLYQLPQVTENEMSPAVVARLADRHANFLFLKDSSGGDRVALEAGDLGGVFLARGAEGRYARWLHETGGPYHGLLLSTANSFPHELRRMIVLLEAGQKNEATELSDRLTQLAEKVFALVSNISQGNVFTNANKTMDHYMAFGTDARDIPPPKLHSGILIPDDVIKSIGEELKSMNLIPEKGYMV